MKQPVILPLILLWATVPSAGDPIETYSGGECTAEPDSFYRWGNDYGLFAEGALGFGRIKHDAERPRNDYGDM